MSWEKEHLWAKARLFFEQAFEYSREDPRFGLWCAMGLELLARAALSSVSPALLAEPEREHKYLLHALGRGAESTGRRSIDTSRVVTLCATLFPDFSADHVKAARALTNRRNDELHTGAAAFEEYTTQQWISGFYACCSVLASAMGQTLEALFGPEEARVATEVLAEAAHEARQRVTELIASHRDAFLGRAPHERAAAKQKAEEESGRLAHSRHHRVTCPACDSIATVHGKPFGPERVTHDEYEVLVRQAVTPQVFACTACGLTLKGYAELVAARLANQYTRTTRYAPAEYFDLIDPADDVTIQSLVEEYLAKEYGEDYDNE